MSTDFAGRTGTTKTMKERKMKRVIVTLAFIAIAAMSYAQTVTNSGWGISGVGAGANIPAGDTTTKKYNVGCVTVDHFDGDRHPTVYISINSKLWVMHPSTVASTSYCTVIHYDAVAAKWVPFGYVAPVTADGKQFAGGVIALNTKSWRVMAFNETALYTPLPTTMTRNDITVYRYHPSPHWPYYIYTFDHTITIPNVGGAMWITEDGNIIMSSVLDFGGPNGVSITTTPVPAPGGLGAPNNNMMAESVQ